MSAIVEGTINITFLHIPKTAGLSITDWLIANRGDNTIHLWREHLKLSAININTYPSFTVIRNPWDRLLSAYFYLKNQIQNYLVNNYIKNNVGEAFSKISFEEFLNEQFEEPPNIKSAKVDSLSTQLYWIDKKIDYILKFEQLDRDFSIIQDIFKCYKPLSHINKTEHANYREYYDSTTKKIVAEKYAEEIDLWKYAF